MINAIIQIPNRLPLGSNLFGGDVVEQNIAGVPVKSLSGRSVRIVPLTFYKFFSQWGTSRYEHIFATDEPIDPIAMSQFVDSTTGELSKSNIGSVLIPISMKKIGQHSIETFLFAKSINFLLSNYQTNVPFSSISFEGVQSVEPDRMIEIPDPIIHQYSGGVSSYGDYRKFLFDSVIYNKYHSHNLPPDVEFALSQMTSERPATIFGCVQELRYKYSSPDQLWSYIEEVYQYENGEPIDPKEFFSEHNYHDSLIDPLTLKCLRSPTYILSSNLKSYISNQLDMRRYGTLGMHPQNDAFTSNIVPFSFEGPMDTYSKYELVENIMSLPEDWFSMRITWDNYIFDQFSMFGNNIFTSAEIIHNSARQLFLNKWVHGEYAYDDIVISKNWYDEVFISCKNKMGVTTYYINLAWFHLISPSLINHTLFTKN